MPLIPLTPQQQIARKIKTKRKILRLKQSELAHAARTSQTAIARLEAAQGNPTIDLLQRVATALNLNLMLTIHPQQPDEFTPPWSEEP